MAEFEAESFVVGLGSGQKKVVACLRLTGFSVESSFAPPLNVRSRIAPNASVDTTSVPSVAAATNRENGDWEDDDMRAEWDREIWIRTIVLSVEAARKIRQLVTIVPVIPALRRCRHDRLRR